MQPDTVKVFGIQIDNCSIQEAAESVLNNAEQGIRESIYFLNAHCVNTAAQDASYLKALKNGRVFGDGAGVTIAAKIAGFRLKENTNGTDLFPVLCELAAKRDLPIALIGGKRDIVTRCAENITKQFKGLTIACALHGFFDQDQESEIIQQINDSGAKIVLIGRGVPLQETWIHQVRDQLEAPQVMAVGGLFDFYSGHRKRAPLFLRKSGLEWLFRLSQEPTRLFSRYIVGNPLFLAKVVKLRLQGQSALRNQLK